MTGKELSSSRRRLAIRAGGRYYVGPDNGLFGIVLEEVGMQQAVERHNRGIVEAVARFSAESCWLARAV